MTRVIVSDHSLLMKNAIQENIASMDVGIEVLNVAEMKFGDQKNFFDSFREEDFFVLRPDCVEKPGAETGAGASMRPR